MPVAGVAEWPGEGGLPRRYRHTFDPFIALAAVAATTERIALGTGVSLVVQHDPIVLAKAVATVDRIAGGRFELGVGPGWNRAEMANHGVDPRTRTARMREHVLAMRAIWDADEAQFHGRFVDFDPILSWPKPAGRLPVLIGGEGPTVLDRVLEYGTGWMPRPPSEAEQPAFGARITELRDRAAAAGRPRPDVTLFGAAPEPGALESCAAAGVDRVLFLVPDVPAVEVLRTLDELAALR